MGQAHQRVMLVGSPRTSSARRRRGLSLASRHCGAVTFSEDAELPTKAVSCNCSICRQKGLLLSFFPADKLTLTSGEMQAAFVGAGCSGKAEESRYCGNRDLEHAKSNLRLSNDGGIKLLSTI
jgi:hypothetical protein